MPLTRHLSLTTDGLWPASRRFVGTTVSGTHIYKDGDSAKSAGWYTTAKPAVNYSPPAALSGTKGFEVPWWNYNYTELELWTASVAVNVV